MSNQLIPFSDPTYGLPMRVIVDDDGYPWFVAADVAQVLGYRMASDLTRRLDTDERGTRSVRTPGGDQSMTVISEPGLYAAILRSRVPEAAAVRRWVTHDVLPAIRRTGSYTVDQAPPVPRSYAAALRAAAEQAEAREAAEARAVALEPSAEAWDQLAEATGDYSMREAAQLLSRDPRVEIGQNRLARYLRTSARWCDSSGQPYQRHVDLGRLVRRTATYQHPRTKEDRIKTQVRVTARGVRDLRALLLDDAQAALSA